MAQLGKWGQAYEKTFRGNVGSWLHDIFHGYQREKSWFVPRHMFGRQTSVCISIILMQVNIIGFRAFTRRVDIYFYISCKCDENVPLHSTCKIRMTYLFCCWRRVVVADVISIYLFTHFLGEGEKKYLWVAWLLRPPLLTCLKFIINYRHMVQISLFYIHADVSSTRVGMRFSSNSTLKAGYQWLMRFGRGAKSVSLEIVSQAKEGFAA